ncbi:hypothetical protein P1A29_10725 [Staphylococcus equorum]|uniref:hypothetical protein n=1 Tax=Staphylococcus equorum TaxID=246432 RepID=UPI002556E6E6|nr:hypothetical protein [Staphylococcus equorum]MDK9860910.1 hypothetical protein [Staphylococcus equorum]
MWTQTPDRQQFSNDELLIYYNPYFIAEKIEDMQMYIESSYTRGLPRLTNDGTNTMYESVSVETLAFEVISQKEDLTKYKIKSLHKLRACRYALSRFDKQSQKKIMKYFKTLGAYRPDELIDEFSTIVFGIRNKQKS